jgi:hypothetical protein
MAISKDKKYLLQNLTVHPATSCSKDEAVGMMLGILKGADWYYDADYDMQRRYEEAHGEGVDTKFFDLSECLNSMRGMLQMAYWDAEESENADEAKLTTLLNDIEQFDTNYMKKAKVYLCLIEDELSKSESELRTIDNGHGVKEITLASLDEWWAKKQNLQQDVKSIEKSIFKDMQGNVPKVRDDENDEELSLSANVTFGLLLRAFVDQCQTEKYGTLNNVKISAVAQKLQSTLAELHTSSSTQGNKSIRNRLNAAEVALKNYNPSI